MRATLRAPALTFASIQSPPNIFRAHLPNQAEVDIIQMLARSWNIIRFFQSIP